jgi:hypothetical protein
MDQHPQGTAVDRVEAPAFLACICSAPECAVFCGPTGLCNGSDTPIDEGSACYQCLNTADSPTLDACFAQDDDLCPDGSDCAALRDCLDACDGP